MKILFFLLINIVFPTLDNEDMNKIVHSPKTYWYDLPRAHQSDFTLHSSFYNISGSLDKFGNGNREFPWDKPGGLLSFEKEGKSLRFIYLPKPIVWYKTDTLIRWIFPTGTIVGECLVLRAKNGVELPYQVRIREKVGKSWVFYVFQPFDSLESLSRAVEHSLVAEIEEHIILGTKFKGQVQIIPEIPEAFTLLTQFIFHDTFGSSWTPDTRTDSSIVPKNNIMFITGDSCVNCHKNTSVHVWEFTSPSERDWYGHIRGDDQIFSFYPFNPSCISHNGFSKKIKFSKKYPIEEYDSEIHKGYFQTGGFK